MFVDLSASHHSLVTRIETCFIADRSLWHLAFIGGEDLDDLFGCGHGPPPDDPPASEIRCTTHSQGITVAGHEILGPSGTRERLIVWAAAHAVFDIHFSETHRVFEVIMFNNVCGFRTRKPPRVAKVLKVLPKWDHDASLKKHAVH